MRPFTQLQHLEQLAASKELSARQQLIWDGCEIQDEAFAMRYREVLAEESYAKVVLQVDGAISFTSAPVTVVLGTTNWHLGSFKTWTRPHLYFGHTREGPVNKTWESLKDGCVKVNAQAPPMQGDIVIFSWNSGVNWDEAATRAQLHRWLTQPNECSFSVYFWLDVRAWGTLTPTL